MDLSKKEWTRLYKEILVVALRITYTSNKKLAWTARDRAQESVQRAMLRYLENRPSDVRDIDSLRSYLVGATRSALGNEARALRTRRETEKEAIAEQKHLGALTTASPEAMNLEAGAAVEAKSRAARVVDEVKALLGRQGDTIALGTIDCIADGHTQPEEQARILGVPVEEIYNARKRRKRAMERVLAELGEPGPEVMP